ncbi:MAG: hypothetical protein AAGN46_14965, partial [Acidobacteriota bacterium]
MRLSNRALRPAVEVAVKAAATATAAVWVLAFSTLLVRSVAIAQEPAPNVRGLTASTSYQPGNLDSINLFTGAVSVGVPIGQAYPVGPSFSYQLRLVYNSTAWDYDQGQCPNQAPYPLPEPNPRTDAGFGWSLHLGKLYPPNTPLNLRDEWVYLSPDGGQHAFFTELHPDQPSPPQSDTWFTDDATYLRLRHRPTAGATCVSVAGTTAACATVESPDGSVREFRNFDLAGGDDWRLTRIRDAFGNAMDSRYPNATTWRITDDQGRQHDVIFDAGGVVGGKVVRVDLRTFGNQVSSWTFAYDAESIPRQAFTRRDCMPASHTEEVAVDLLAQVTQPDGSFWRMTHALTDAAPQILSGGLLDLRLPSGGKIAWTYQVYDFNTFGDPDEIDANPYKVAYGIATRSLFDFAGAAQPIGTWTYDYRTDAPAPGGGTQDPACFHSNTVTDPLGNAVRHYFSTSAVFSQRWAYGLPYRTCNGAGGGEGPPYLSQEFFEGSADTGTLVRSIFVEFTADGVDGQRGRNVQQTFRRLVFEDDGDRVRETRWENADGFGKWRTTRYDGNVFGAEVEKVVSTAWNPSTGTLTRNPQTGAEPPSSTFVLPGRDDPWVFNWWTSREIQQGGDRSVVEACFDASTGYLERARALAGGSPANQDVVTRYTSEIVGGRETGRVAREDVWGGDDGPALDTFYGDLCQMTLPSSSPAYRLDHAYAGAVRSTSSWRDPDDGTLLLSALDATIDTATGLPSRARDAAGVETVFGWDRMGRPTSMRPPDTASTAYTYSFPTVASPNRETSTLVQLCAIGTTGCLQSQDLAFSYERFDGLGRKELETASYPSQAGGDRTFEDRRFTYNALNWPLTISTWGSAQRTTRYLNYDRFGRVGLIDPPGSQLPSIEMRYSGDRLIERRVRVGAGAGGGLVDAWTTEVYDAFGRLVRLCEAQDAPFPGSCQDALTRYEYDELDRLTEVRQNPGVAGGGQTRRFTYDGRGVMRSEQNPEVGPSGNGSTTYTFDALGNVLTRSIAGSTAFDLEYAYDRAGRLIRVAELGGRPLQEQFYGFTNAGSDRKRGKLVAAKRYNYVSVAGPLAAPTGAISGTVVDRYRYAGRNGALSQKTTSFTLGTGTSSFR